MSYSQFLIGILVVLTMCPAATAQWEWCPGCTDDSPDIQQPDPVSLDLTMLHLGDIEVTVELTRWPGQCFRLPDEHPWYGRCDEEFPCSPEVKIDVHLNETHGFLAPVTWTVVSSGTICNLGHPNGSLTASGDALVNVFDNALEVNCGDDCSIDAQYDIKAHFTYVGQPLIINTRIEVDGTLSCQMCSL